MVCDSFARSSRALCCSGSSRSWPVSSLGASGWARAIRSASAELPPPASPIRAPSGWAFGKMGRFTARSTRLQVVEGKGFVLPDAHDINDLAGPPLHQPAPSGTPRPPASTPDFTVFSRSSARSRLGSSRRRPRRAFSASPAARRSPRWSPAASDRTLRLSASFCGECAVVELHDPVAQMVVAVVVADHDDTLAAVSQLG